MVATDASHQGDGCRNCGGEVFCHLRAKSKMTKDWVRSCFWIAVQPCTDLKLLTGLERIFNGHDWVWMDFFESRRWTCGPCCIDSEVPKHFTSSWFLRRWKMKEVPKHLKDRHLISGTFTFLGSSCTQSIESSSCFATSAFTSLSLGTESFGWSFWVGICQCPDWSSLNIATFQSTWV